MHQDSFKHTILLAVPTLCLCLASAASPANQRPTRTTNTARVTQQNLDDILFASFKYVSNKFEGSETGDVDEYSDRPISDAVIRRLKAAGVKAVRGSGSAFPGASSDSPYFFHTYVSGPNWRGRYHVLTDVSVEHICNGCDELFDFGATLRLAKIRGHWRVTGTVNVPPRNSYCISSDGWNEYNAE